MTVAESIKTMSVIMRYSAMVSHNTKMLPPTLVGGNFFFCSKITLIANKQRKYRKYFMKFSISSLVLRRRLVYYVISTKYTNTISISCYDFSLIGGGMCAKRKER